MKFNIAFFLLCLFACCKRESRINSGFPCDEVLSGSELEGEMASDVYVDRLGLDGYMPRGVIKIGEWSKDRIEKSIVMGMGRDGVENLIGKPAKNFSLAGTDRATYNFDVKYYPLKSGVSGFTVVYVDGLVCGVDFEYYEIHDK